MNNWNFRNFALSMMFAQTVVFGAGAVSHAEKNGNKQPTVVVDAYAKDATAVFQRMVVQPYFLVCGESYYAISQDKGQDDSLYEFKGVTVSTRGSVAKDEVDKANGYEWYGEGELTYKMGREFKLRGDATDWTEWSRFSYGNMMPILPKDRQGLNYDVVKRHGQWQVTRSLSIVTHTDLRRMDGVVTCSGISQLFSKAIAENTARIETKRQAAIDEENTIEPKLDRSKPIEEAEKYYPKAAKKKGETGSVIVGIYVDQNGRITQTRIDEGCGYADLDEAAMRYAQSLPFLPGTVYGKLQSMWGQLRVSFGFRKR